VNQYAPTLETVIVVLAALLLVGCAGATGNMNATDPVERGLSYVAAAIVTAAIIRAFFNK
jgi:hypothetical protein